MTRQDLDEKMMDSSSSLVERMWAAVMLLALERHLNPCPEQGVAEATAALLRARIEVFGDRDEAERFVVDYWHQHCGICGYDDSYDGVPASLCVAAVQYFKIRTCRIRFSLGRYLPAAPLLAQRARRNRRR